MQGEIIKSFLVSLGFDVDESSLALFNKSIQTAALRVTALYGAVNAFAGSMVYAFSKISEGFEEMGYQYHILAPAISKAVALRNELFKAYSAAGINIRKVILDSVKLNFSLAKTKFALEAIYKSVGSKFFGLLTKESDIFRKKLYESMPYIIKSLETLVRGVFKAFDISIQLGERLWSILGRVYDFFVLLDSKTGGWSTTILAVIAAWKLLNLEFLATPLGALIAGLGTLLLLFDDYKTYKEGGKSLFDWGYVLPLIAAISNALEGLRDVLTDVVNLAKDFWNADWTKVLSDIKAIADAFDRIDAAVTKLVRMLGGDFVNKLLDVRDRIDTEFFSSPSRSGADYARSLQQVQVANSPLANPLGSSTVTNSQSTQNVNLQTAINVTGTPNASAFDIGQSALANQNAAARDAAIFANLVLR